MTLRGAQQLREELRQRKSEMRPQIIASIEEARQHGDLKENAEYHAAREQHGFNEGRIQEIESKLGSAQVIDPTQVAANGTVIFGATVELSDADSGAEQTWQLVGEQEAEEKDGRISLTSRTAKAPDGRGEGE